MADAKDRKQHQRKRRRRTEALYRVLLSLVIVLVAHGVLGGLAWIKLSRASSSSAPDSGEGLRIWSMSEEDPLLTVEARDFLELNKVMLHGIEPLRLDARPDSACQAGSGVFLSSESEKVRRGIRLGWEGFTGVLDRSVSTDGLSLSAFCGFGLQLSPGIGLSLSHDLDLYDLGVDWGVWSRQLQNLPSSWVPVPRRSVAHGAVRVSKYENRSWSTVDAPSLRVEASDVLRSRSSGSGSTELGDVWLEVFGSPTGGARVHLRRSCGLRALDDLSLRWVLEHHRQLGHHHTDGVQVDGRRSHVEYLIEFGEVPSRLE